MENIISRHRNLSILAVVLFAQILGLAVQVKRGTDQGSSRLIRVWTVEAITPFAKGVVHSTGWFADTWHNYLYLRHVREQNAKLREEIARMRLEQVRMVEDAGQARRLQSLLGFKEQFISQTMAAQVISTTGSEFSRGIYIDKGSRDGIKPDMPVITPDGVVGKVLRVYPTSSLVLEINDPSSGAGVILEKSRLQGILKGSPTGEAFVANIMADEKIEAGERILSSGGDRVYPKGLAVGTVARVKPAGTFLNVEVKPAAHLDRLEEVLVITKVVEKTPQLNDQNEPVRAVDILTQRLPSVPPKPEPKPDPASKTKASAVPSTALGAGSGPRATASAQTDQPGGTKPEAKQNPEAAAKVATQPANPPATAGQADVNKKKPVAITGPHLPTAADVGHPAAARQKDKVSTVPSTALATGSGEGPTATAHTGNPAGAKPDAKPSTLPKAKSGNPPGSAGEKPAAKPATAPTPNGQVGSGQTPTARPADTAKPENTAKETPR